MEEWKDVFGYEGKYEVSNYGRVRSKNRRHFDRILKPYCRNGYLTVCLSNEEGAKRWLVHVLVMEAFNYRERKRGYDKKLVIDHIDFDKANNRIDNLRWCSQAENLKHSIDEGRRGKKCKDITTGKEYKTMADAARDMKAPSITAIKRVCDGERNHYKKHIFRYVRSE